MVQVLKLFNVHARVMQQMMSNENEMHRIILSYYYTIILLRVSHFSHRAPSNLVAANSNHSWLHHPRFRLPH